MLPFPVGKGGQGEKGPVDKAAAVYDQEFICHGLTPA
jgi:hypothetical protein